MYGLRAGEHPAANADDPAWRLTNAVPDVDAALAAHVQAKAPAGSVLFFTEALIHSAVQVLSERMRYALFIQCTPQGVTTREGWRPAEERPCRYLEGTRSVRWADSRRGRAG